MSAAEPRCLLVAQTFPPLLGGSAEVYAALAAHAGGAIRVLTGWRDHRSGYAQPGWRELDAGLPFVVRRLPLVRPPDPASGLGWGLGAAARLAAIVALEALRHRADAVCVCDDETVGWLVPFIRFGLGRRALIYCHGDDLVETSAAAIARRRRWFGFAHVVIAAGDFAASRLRDPYGVPPARILTVPNGVDLDRFAPRPADPALRAALGIGPGPVLLSAGRLIPRKGFDRLIKALTALRARHPGLVLLILGDGPQRAELERLAAGLPVRFLGARAAREMPDFHALADVFVLANRAEPGEADGLPLVLLEAMACARPVVAGRAGGTSEAVRDGETGLLVEANSPAEIARAIGRLLDEPALAARLAAAGRRLAENRGWEQQTRHFLAACAAPQLAR